VRLLLSIIHLHENAVDYASASSTPEVVRLILHAISVATLSAARRVSAETRANSSCTSISAGSRPLSPHLLGENSVHHPHRRKRRLPHSIGRLPETPSTDPCASPRKRGLPPRLQHLSLEGRWLTLRISAERRLLPRVQHLGGTGRHPAHLRGTSSAASRTASRRNRPPPCASPRERRRQSPAHSLGRSVERPPGGHCETRSSRWLGPRCPVPTKGKVGQR
jgi:hypothetical protein